MNNFNIRTRISLEREPNLLLNSLHNLVMIITRWLIESTNIGDAFESCSQKRASLEMRLS